MMLVYMEVYNFLVCFGVKVRFKYVYLKFFIILYRICYIFWFVIGFKKRFIFYDIKKKIIGKIIFLF